jgi:hypothetical protein
MRPASDADFEPTDPALREDVRRLGRLVGELLVEQNGEAFYARVEAARTTAIARRREAASLDALARQLDGLDAATAEAVARAFTTYFQMVNIAERVQRIRRRRNYQIAGASPQPDGLHDVLLRLREAGIGADVLFATLPRIDVEPVLTAHPTEVTRRVLLEKEQQIVRALVADLVGPRTPAEREVDWARLRMALTSTWQTADVARERPGVLDELEHVDFYLADPIYRVVPALYEALERAVVDVYGACPALPRLLRFANWAGGDMDGNPNANAATVAAALRRQRHVVIERYRAECAQLARLLTQTLDRVGVSAAVLERLDTYRTLLPQAAAKIRPRHADMPYRNLLHLVGARLAASAHDAAEGYSNAAELAEDIECIGRSLREHAGVHAGWFAVRRLLWRVRTFGFHLARLDTRQDAPVCSGACGCRRIVARRSGGAVARPRTICERRARAARSRCRQRAWRRAGRVRRARTGTAQPRRGRARHPYREHGRLRRRPARRARAGAPAASSTTPARCRSTSRPCSRRSATCAPPRQRSAHCSTNRCTARISPRATTARSSCSVIPTAPRTAASSPRAGPCSGRRSNCSRRRTKLACASSSSTAAAARSAAAAARPRARSWPRRAARSTAIWALPNRARSSTRSTPSARSRCAPSSRPSARCCWRACVRAYPSRARRAGARRCTRSPRTANAPIATCWKHHASPTTSASPRRST